MTRSPSRSLLKALGFGPRELVAIVGAGGKTSLMYRIAEEAQKAGVRAAAATTTKILPPGCEDPCTLLCAESYELLRERLSGSRDGISVIGRGVLPNGKVEGIPAPWCDRLYAEHLIDVLAVESDGARRRPLKAPGGEEPVVPPKATLFVAVVGLRCLGQPLGDDVAFRPERVAAAAGCRLGADLTPEIIARLLAAPDGLLKGRGPAARAVAFLNQADDPGCVAAGREVASALLDHATPWERVVIGRLRDREPIEEVWVS